MSRGCMGHALSLRRPSWIRCPYLDFGFLCGVIEAKETPILLLLVVNKGGESTFWTSIFVMLCLKCSKNASHAQS